MLAGGEATMKAATDDERKTLQNFVAEGVIATEDVPLPPRPRDELRTEGSARLGSRLLGAEEAHGEAGPETHDESVVRNVAPGRHAPAPALTFAAPGPTITPCPA
jgi:hypothetical protein